MSKEDKFGLALSGGGYRAAVYHIGTLRTLKKLKLLDKIDVLSTNSGGSITGACYSLHHKNFKMFEKVLVEGVQRSVIGGIFTKPRFFIPTLLILGFFALCIWLLFTAYAWINIILFPLFIVAMMFAQFEILPISRIIESIYDDLFFDEATLKDFSKTFRTTINSTNLDTGRVFQFSQDNMGDSKYTHRGDDLESIRFKHENFPVSRAVMSSSCVPGAFTPVKMAKEYFQNPKQYDEVKPSLVDGGIYDNQGIHKLTFHGSSSYCKNVIISDAGTGLAPKGIYKNVVALLLRTMDVFMARIKNFQMMNNLYRVPTERESIVAYQSISFDLDNSIEELVKMIKSGYAFDEVVKAHGISDELIEKKKWDKIEALIAKNVKVKDILKKGCNPAELEIARTVGTNLTPLSKAQTDALIKHAEAITEMQVKVFLPHLL